MYEVNLSDCDGSRADIWLFECGAADLRGNSRSKAKRLARLRKESEHDDEMPEWARAVMRKLEA